MMGNLGWLTYNTAYKIYSKIRLAIYHFVSKEDTKFQGEVEADILGGRREEREEGGQKVRVRYQCLEFLKCKVK